MITLKNLQNPNIKNSQFDITLPESTQLGDINKTTLDRVISGYVGVCKDDGEVTGVIKTERLNYLVSKQKDQSLIQVIDELEHGFVAIDTDTRVFYANLAYEKILNVNISKIMGRYLSIIEPEAALLNVLKTGKSIHEENQYVKSIGKYVKIDAYPIIRGEKVVGAYSIFTDVTSINELHEEMRRISAVAQEYGKQVEAQKQIQSEEMIGKSKPFMECIAKAAKVAPTDTAVLLRGENGSGKELIADFIKKTSCRKDNEFIAVNCSAIPDSLIESELFGYEEGAFTGAVKGGKLGMFQLADRGTIFLDEIGDMGLQMQSKLLRVLQTGEIEKVGRQGKIPVDVRVIAATNKPLEDMVEKGSFREDLYYRLNVISINVPPLRARGNDVLLLIDYYMEKYCDRYNRKLRLSLNAYQAFLAYSWPGNIRELSNAIESAVILTEGDIINTDSLPESMQQSKKIEKNNKIDEETEIIIRGTLKEEVERFEKRVISSAMKKYNGDKKMVMESLGLSERTFYRKTAKNGTKTI